MECDAWTAHYANNGWYSEWTTSVMCSINQIRWQLHLFHRFFPLDSTADYQIIDECFSCSTRWHWQSSTSGRSPAIITFSTMHSTDKVLAFHPPAREIAMRPWRFRSCARNPIRLSLARFLLLWPVRGWSGEWCMLFINLHCSPRGQLPAGGRIRAPSYLQQKPCLVIFRAGINPALTRCWYNVGPAS